MRIADIQEHAGQLRAAHGWQQSPEVRLVYLMTEVGEVSSEALRLSEARTEEERQQAREALGMEIYDVVWNLCDLANILEVDLEAAFEKKAAQNRDRLW